MSQVEELKKAHAHGQPIFEELFALNDKDLKVKLKSIAGVGEDVGGLKGIDDKLIDEGSVKRIIRDENPEEIEIYFYDSIKIDWQGIHFKPEHGSTSKKVSFNENFKL